MEPHQRPFFKDDPKNFKIYIKIRHNVYAKLLVNRNAFQVYLSIGFSYIYELK